MDISVVLCTYNNAERLRITFRAFCQLNQPDGVAWELVTVNNNSSDHTEEVVQAFEDRLPITYVYEPEQGLSRARNAGLEVAQGDLIVFTDDDVKPNPDWLVAYWEAYQDRPEGYYFGGPIESEYEGKPPDADLMRVAMPSVVGLDHGSEPRELSEQDLLVGANWALPSKYLRQVGSFNENIGLNATADNVSVGEEADMMSRLEERGFRKWYVPEAQIKHFVPESKCTLDHVIARRTAGLENAYAPGSPMPNTFLGIPAGLYREAFLHWFDWIARRWTGEYWKKEYVHWCQWKERLRAYHFRNVK